MDQLSAMRAFIRVVETGNFTRAAQAQGLAKSSLTSLVQALEAHLNTKLLNRTTRRVMVTTDGALYYERALRIVGEIDEIDGSLSHSQTTASGRLRVEMAGIFADWFLIPSLDRFSETFPDIQLDLGVGDRTVDYLAENVDIALRGGQPTDQSLIARRVGQVDLILCAAPRYITKSGIPDHPLDFTQSHQCVAYLMALGGRIMPFSFDNEDEKIEIVPNYVLSTNDGRSYLAGVLSGLGAGLLPRFAVAEALANGQLVALLPEWRIQPIPLYVIYPPNRHLSNKVRVFVDWLVVELAEFGLNVQSPTKLKRIEKAQTPEA